MKRTNQSGSGSGNDTLSRCKFGITMAGVAILGGCSIEYFPPYQVHQGNRGLSIPAGIYAEGFETTSIPNGSWEFRYTEDGSEVSLASPLLPTSLWIQSVVSSTTSEGVKVTATLPISRPYFAIMTVPTLDDYGANDKGHFVPWEPPRRSQLRGKSFRVAAFSSLGFRMSEETFFYLIQSPSEQSRLPIASIVANPDDLFSFDHGVLVPGKAFYKATHVDRWSGNYSQKTEIPISIQFFVNGKAGAESKAGLRVGGQNPNIPIKTLRVFARSEYGPPSIEVPGFPRLDSLKRFDIRNGGIPEFQHGYFTDHIAQSLLASSGLETQQGIPMVLYLNGEYWGLYTLQERQDEHYLQAHYDLSDLEKEGIDLLDGGTYTVGNDDAWSATASLWSTVTDQDTVTSTLVEEIAEQVDIDNLAKIFAAEIYFANNDWPRSWNERRWHLRFPKANSPGLDGKWRWMLFDLDAGFGSAWTNPEVNAMDKLLDKNYPMYVLIRNPAYRVFFVTTMVDYLNTYFRESVAYTAVEKTYDLVKDEMPAHIDRWGYPKSMEYWQFRMGKLREFALLRPGIIRQQLRDWFNSVSANTKLGAEFPITISLEPGHSGTVKVNSINVNPVTPGFDALRKSWTGTYPVGIPVIISAVPGPKETFSHWKETGSTEASQQIELDKGISFTPVFRDKDAQ